MALTSRRVRQYEMDPEALERQLDDAFSGISVEELNESLNASICDVKIGEIVIAKVDTERRLLDFFPVRPAAERAKKSTRAAGQSPARRGKKERGRGRAPQRGGRGGRSGRRR